MKLQTLNTWHKALGMTATLFLLVLSISGFLLLHTDDLRLQDRLIANNMLLDWYGIEPEQEPVSYLAGGQWFTYIDKQVYFELKALPQQDQRLTGAVALDEFYVLAYVNSMDLLTADGDLIERLTEVNGLPADIQSVGKAEDDRVYIKTSNGDFASDVDLSVWKQLHNPGVTWSIPSEPPPELTQQLLGLYRGTGLPMERVVLDLHSGRILGRTGVWLVDIAVLIFLALSLTGWWSWFKRRTLQKQIDEEY